MESGSAYRLGFSEAISDNSTEFGEFEIVLTSEIDLSNPFVKEHLLYFRVRNDPPPAPKLLGEEAPGNYDWTAVWRWSRQNPEISIDEIAELLNYSPALLHHELALLEQTTQ